MSKVVLVLLFVVPFVSSFSTTFFGDWLRQNRDIDLPLKNLGEQKDSATCAVLGQVTVALTMSLINSYSASATIDTTDSQSVIRITKSDSGTWGTEFSPTSTQAGEWSETIQLPYGTYTVDILVADISSCDSSNEIVISSSTFTLSSGSSSKTITVDVSSAFAVIEATISSPSADTMSAIVTNANYDSDYWSVCLFVPGGSTSFDILVPACATYAVALTSPTQFGPTSTTAAANSVTTVALASTTSDVTFEIDLLYNGNSLNSYGLGGDCTDSEWYLALPHLRFYSTATGGEVQAAEITLASSTLTLLNTWCSASNTRKFLVPAGDYKIVAYVQSEYWCSGDLYSNITEVEIARVDASNTGYKYVGIELGASYGVVNTVVDLTQVSGGLTVGSGYQESVKVVFSETVGLWLTMTTLASSGASSVSLAMLAPACTYTVNAEANGRLFQSATAYATAGTSTTVSVGQYTNGIGLIGVNLLLDGTAIKYLSLSHDPSMELGYRLVSSSNVTFELTQLSSYEAVQLLSSSSSIACSSNAILAAPSGTYLLEVYIDGLMGCDLGLDDVIVGTATVTVQGNAIVSVSVEVGSGLGVIEVPTSTASTLAVVEDASSYGYMFVGDSCDSTQAYRALVGICDVLIGRELASSTSAPQVAVVQPIAGDVVVLGDCGVVTLGSPSSSNSATTSVSASASETASASNSGSPSASASKSLPPSSTPTASSSASATKSATPSVSGSPSGSVSATNSPSNSATRSASPSVSATQSASASPTQSASAAVSASSSASSTASMSISLTASSTRSSSASVSASATNSATPSVSSSNTASRSASLPASSSISASASSTRSSSASVSASATNSATPSVSSSNTASRSASLPASSSISASASSTRSSSASISASSSLSRTSSASVSKTGSASVSKSASASVSSSMAVVASASVSPSKSSTPSVSGSSSASVSRSASPTASKSLGSSASTSPSRSASASVSSTASLSASRTATASVSLSRSASSSLSPSPSPSISFDWAKFCPTTGTIPISALIGRVSSGAAAASTACIG
eukprot:c12651_g1_i1.p1 GENE.c12651_g1_i1~~c12651_g1_i1.p1  ORF type:complete len:1054 (+),score=272.04 c12651_g1_i1:24-3164(+)